MLPEGLPDWERLLAAERHLQAIVFAPFDELYGQDGGASPLVEVVERLAAAAPSDAPEVDLRTYKALVAPWNDWSHLSARGRHWAEILAKRHLTGGGR